MENRTMTEAKDSTTTRRRRAGAKARASEPAQMIPTVPQTEEEKRESEDMIRQLAALAAELRQRNLNRAVRLAQQAAGGRGPLVAHFAELGRRFGHTLDQTPPKPRLRVVEGGAP